MNDFDFSAVEPSAADLAAIEFEEPLINAEIEMLNAEIGILYAAERGGPTPLDWRRLRRANRRVIRAALDLDAVARAPHGTRRNTLYGAARGVARMVAAGSLTPADAYQALYDAGVRAQQTHRDIHAAILGGFRAESVVPPGIAA
ncbi:DUF6284 family protein [Couchioplanes azureus]|uniref:DUF6284 family protein n=1 Tax=Couchioplanes caeruleus TaxID=56438 RepID=UPI0019AE6085|nr:DUF6284 family protein [Couchioplanes caeruleus]GGQ77539.1 hypothetical protein GCM10010166_54360 [Couchioplanes caeruleus subsp. azureus]